MSELLTEKKCSSCKVCKGVEEFQKNSSRPDGLRSSCKVCTSKRWKHYYAKNKDKLNVNRKALHRYYRYGITQEEYDNLVERQDGLCACCGRKPDTLHLDHSHETGVVRGLLCPSCNMALGMLGDDIEGVMNALWYLLQTQ